MTPSMARDRVIFAQTHITKSLVRMTKQNLSLVKLACIQEK